MIMIMIMIIIRKFDDYLHTLFPSLKVLTLLFGVKDVCYVCKANHVG